MLVKNRELLMGHDEILGNKISHNGIQWLDLRELEFDGKLQV